MVIDSPYGISNGITSGTGAGVAGAAGGAAISACAVPAAKTAHANDIATMDLCIKSSPIFRVPSGTSDGCIIGCRNARRKDFAHELTAHSRFRDRTRIARFRDVNSRAVPKAIGALILRLQEMGDCDVHVQEEA
jgi:hypothetical protein